MSQDVIVGLTVIILGACLFSYLAVWVWMKHRRLEREAFYRSETLKKIAESQGGGGNSAIEFLRESEKNAVRRRREGQKLGGMISVALGIAIFLFVLGNRSGGSLNIYTLGLIPLFIGLAVLGYVYLLAAKE